MMRIKVNKTATEHGLKLAKKVYLEKQNYNPKSLQADIYGFVASSLVCEHFGEPMPDFTGGKYYDLKLKGKKIDVKKVGYDNHTKTIKIMINKRQYERKKGNVDEFLFCTFIGGFSQIHISDIQMFIPMPELCELELIGTIKYDDIPKNSYMHRIHRGSNTDDVYVVSLDSITPYS